MKFGDIEKFHNWINSLRNKHQLFVFYQIESPYHVQLPYSKHNNFFNATISYRKNSSFRYPYSSIADINRLMGWTSMKEWEVPKKKYGAIVAFSNCRVEFRNKLISKLAELVKFKNGTPAFDVFGKCADLVQTNESRLLTENRIKEMGLDLSDRKSKLPTKQYHFYMAIENSRCRDYITEKFFFNALMNQAVPIVIGPPREDYEEYVPADSFIHVSDFDTVEDLADRINYLLGNETAYLKYFDWRKRDYSDNKYFMSTKEQLVDEGFCKLCKMAHEMRNGNGFEFPVIQDFQKFWNGQSEDGLSNSLCDRESKLKYKNEPVFNETRSSKLSLKFNDKSGIMDLSSIAINYPTVKALLDNLDKASFKTTINPTRKFPQLVTGLSLNHLSELKPHLLEFINFTESTEFLKYFDKPEKIVIWNLDHVDKFQEMHLELTELINNRIKLDFRQFDFRKFPVHVYSLGNFAWKIIINTMMLTEFGAIWWFDSSIMPLKGEIKFEAENQKILSKYEVLANMTKLQIHSKKACYLFTAAGSNTDYSSFTCPKMYKYLNFTEDKFWNAWVENQPTIEKLTSKESADMQQAGAALQSVLYDEDKSCRNGIFKPMLFCALIEECIKPSGAQKKVVPIEETEHCRHRYDQSVTNLVVNEFYGYDKTRFVMRGLMYTNGLISNKKLTGWRHLDDVVGVVRHP